MHGGMRIWGFSGYAWAGLCPHMGRFLLNCFRGAGGVGGGQGRQQPSATLQQASPGGKDISAWGGMWEGAQQRSPRTCRCRAPEAWCSGLHAQVVASSRGVLMWCMPSGCPPPRRCCCAWQWCGPLRSLARLATPGATAAPCAPSVPPSPPPPPSIASPHPSGPPPLPHPDPQRPTFHGASPHPDNHTLVVELALHPAGVGGGTADGVRPPCGQHWAQRPPTHASQLAPGQHHLQVRRGPHPHQDLSTRHHPRAAVADPTPHMPPPPPAATQVHHPTSPPPESLHQADPSSLPPPSPHHPLASNHQSPSTRPKT